MKQLALYTAVVLTTLGGAALVFSFPEAVVMFVISLAIAAVIRPVLENLTQRGMPSGFAVLITFLVIIAGMVGLTWSVSALLVKDIGLLGDNLSILYDRMWATWPLGSSLQRTIIQQLPPPEELFTVLAGEQGGVLVSTLLGATSSSFGFLSQFFGALILSIYWTADRIQFERMWLSILPVETRARWREVGRDVETALGGYIRSELAQSLMVGFLLGGGYTLMGIPYPTALALFAALAWLLPWIGGVLVLISILIIGLLIGFPMGVVAIVYTVAVLLLMEYVIEPRITIRRQYSPWLTIILLMIMGDSLGLIGVVIAPPLAVMIQITARRIQQESQQTLTPSIEILSARRIAQLDQRIVVVRDMIANMEEAPPPHTTSMLDRLAALVRKAQEISQERP